MADFEKKDSDTYKNHPWEETKRALTVLEGLLNCFIWYVGPVKFISM